MFTDVYKITEFMDVFYKVSGKVIKMFHFFCKDVIELDCFIFC